MKLTCEFFLIFCLTSSFAAKDCSNKKSNSKLVCYYGNLEKIDNCLCSHVILPANTNVEDIKRVEDEVKETNLLLTVHEINENLIKVLKNTKIKGLEIDLKKMQDKKDVIDFISTIKSKIDSSLTYVVSLPSKAEDLAKFYDLKALSEEVDFFILQTWFLGPSQNVTFHPSRLSGLWDMQNIDSVVDLVNGMGAPLSKLVITSPVQAFQFTLQHEDFTAPGSPALKIKSLTRKQLCNTMSRSSNWTLERDQDQTAPYIFRKNLWIAFEDRTSIDIKAKYSRIRGLAGLALKDLSQDGGEKCGGVLLEAAFNGLSKQSRAPRGAVLQSLEREILETQTKPLQSIQVSPYRIARVVDVEGNIHSVRQDTRTEFECSRQGYFVHPRSCGRFYRCVKFDQLVEEFSVFEFDCPSGLAFDSRYEVCVWPGSLPDSSPCSGSSEIAPVPRNRFSCPATEGYYADPENCRWFFACLDHGQSSMIAYEFRCPFGLVFDESRLLCEWSWLVPKCGSGIYTFRTQNAGSSLLNYNGLGDLILVTLGGVSGPLVQTQAKSYSSSSAGIALIPNLGYKQRVTQSKDFSNSFLYNLQRERDNFKANQNFQNTYKNQNINVGSAFRSNHDDLETVQFFGKSSTDNTYNQQGNRELNIVGGFSAVGANNRKSGYNGQQPGVLRENIILVPSLVAPIAAVPVPAVTDDTIYAKGVVANVPELQYKIKSNSDYNATKSFVNYIANIPKPSAIHYGTSSFIQTPTIKASTFYQIPHAISTSTSDLSYQSPRQSQEASNHRGNSYTLNQLPEFSEQLSQSNLALSQHIVQNPQLITNYAFQNSARDQGYSYNKATIPITSGFGLKSFGNLQSKKNYNGVAIDNVVLPGGEQHHHSSLANKQRNSGGAFSYGFNGPVEANPQVVAVSYQQATPLQKIVVGQPAPSFSYGAYGQPGASSSLRLHNSGGGLNMNLNSNAQQSLAPTVTSSYSNHNFETLKYNSAKAQPASFTNYLASNQDKLLHENYNPPVVNVAPALSSVLSTYNLEMKANNQEIESVLPVVNSSPQPAAVSSYSFQNAHRGDGYNYKGQTQESPSGVLVQDSGINAGKADAKIISENYKYNTPQLIENYELPTVSISPVTPAEFSNYNLGYQSKNKQFEILVGTTPSPQPAVVKNYGFQKQNQRYRFQGGSSDGLIQNTVTVVPTVVSSYSFGTNARNTQIETVVPFISASTPPQPAEVGRYTPTYHNNEYKYNIAKSLSGVTVENYEIPRVSVAPGVSKVAVPILSVSSTPPPSVVSSYSFENAHKNGEYKYNVAKTESKGPSRILVQSYNFPRVSLSSPVPTIVSSYSFGDEIQNKGIGRDLPVVTVSLTANPKIVSNYNIHNVQNEGDYQYNVAKAQSAGSSDVLVQNYDLPRVSVSSPAPAIISSYSFDAKTPNKKLEDVLPIVNVNSTPRSAVISSYAFQNAQSEDGYQYNTAKAEIQSQRGSSTGILTSNYITGTSAVPTVTSSFNKRVEAVVPIVSVSSTSQTPLLSSYYSQKDGSIYKPHPRIENYNHPRVSISSTAPTVISSYSFGAKVDNNAPIVSVTPAVTSYNPTRFQKVLPIIPIAPAVVPSYAATSNLNQTTGLFNYKAVVQDPLTAVFNVRSKTNEDYKFIEPQPEKTGVTTFQDVTKPKPFQSISRYQEINNDKGYFYPKPSIAFEEESFKVTPDQKSPVFPSTIDGTFVINAYYGNKINSGVVSSTTPKNIHILEGYDYPKPSVSFEEGSPVYEAPFVARKTYPLGQRVQSTYQTPVITSTIKYDQVSTNNPFSPYMKPKIVEDYSYFTPKTDVYISTPTPFKASGQKVFFSTTEGPSRYSSSKSKLVDGNFVVKPKTKTYIRVNDFQPFLPAKLGATCTCRSNTLNLRRPSKTLIEVDDDNDGYYVKPNPLASPNKEVILENYSYKPERVVDITPTPIVVIKSTTNSIPTIVKRIRVQPPRSKVSRVVIEELAPEVVVAPQEQVLSNAFDRYGPGGLRSRQETLQGTIDCQRAGLFRHPEQCNKFYACRWDCTKNRFTLHVFNCPVQLTFDSNLGACNWPSQGPACSGNTLLPNE